MSGILFVSVGRGSVGWGDFIIIWDIYVLYEFCL